MRSADSKRGVAMDLRSVRSMEIRAVGDPARTRAPDAASRASGKSAVLRDLFARLAADRFNITLVGRFSRGKTSLMNAILGMDRLPTGVVPLTSVITEVTYGSEAKAVLHYRAHQPVHGHSACRNWPPTSPNMAIPATIAASAWRKCSCRPNSCAAASPSSTRRASARRSPPTPARLFPSCPKPTQSFSSPAMTARCRRRKPTS